MTLFPKNNSRSGIYGVTALLCWKYIVILKRNAWLLRFNSAQTLALATHFTNTWPSLPNSQTRDPNTNMWYQLLALQARDRSASYSPSGDFIDVQPLSSKFTHLSPLTGKNRMKRVCTTGSRGTVTLPLPPWNSWKRKQEEILLRDISYITPQISSLYWRSRDLNTTGLAGRGDYPWEVEPCQTGK